MDWLIPFWPVLPIIFISAFIRSALGFGDALVAMPLLAMTISMTVATPLVAIIASTSAMLILLKDWQKADWRSAGRLIIAAFFGTIAGLYSLKNFPEIYMKFVLGAVIAVYGLYNLIRPTFQPITGKPQLTMFFGFLSGLLGGAYNTNGPPIVIYGRLRGWQPAHFRATLQGYFLPAGMMITLGHGLSGLWTETVFMLYLACLPLVVLAIWIGGIVNRRLPYGKFDRYLNIALVIMGVLLIYKAWTG